MTTHTPAPLNLANVQGDILAGLPKKTQTYVLFEITDAQAFRTALTHLIPLITSTEQVKKDRHTIDESKKDAAHSGHLPPLLDIVSVNVAFSQLGLNKLGIKDDIKDAVFKNGQSKDASNLGDPGTTNASGVFVPDWIDAFKKGVHGVFIVSGASHILVSKKVEEIEHIFGVHGHHASYTQLLSIVGDVRPGKEKGHEHFGFLDGISQPAVKGVDTNPNPGQETIRQGIMLLGREGDDVAAQRPSWALDGSFLAFRYLFQLVPEFNKFLHDNPIDLPGLTRAEGSELLGARFMGRWKSGAPIDITPLKDDPVLAADPKRNNNFRFQGETDSQTRCPFSAHVRKTNPRADLEDATPTAFSTETRRIIRRGVQFGPELTVEEQHANKTIHGRGLIFAAYQANLTNGFQFIQKSWANTPGFIFGRSVTPGHDPIIGQAGSDGAREVSGSNPNAQANELTLPTQWVVPKGGEYFFSPSIPALRDTFALGVHIESH